LGSRSSRSLAARRAAIRGRPQRDASASGSRIDDRGARADPVGEAVDPAAIPARSAAPSRQVVRDEHRDLSLRLVDELVDVVTHLLRRPAGEPARLGDVAQLAHQPAVLAVMCAGVAGGAGVCRVHVERLLRERRQGEHDGEHAAPWY
jgi:hypothetical protein